MKENDPIELLRPLFKKAQATEEFEFCCTILRIRGSESAGWDTLQESYATMNQLLGEIQSPIDDFFRLRLVLFLYCHAIEIDDVYNVIANLLRICKKTGEKFSMTPFMAELHFSKQTVSYPHDKVLRIAEWATEMGFNSISERMKFFLIKQVRNAFVHSDYIIYQNNFNIKHGEGVLINGSITKSLSLQWLTPRLEAGINFVLATLKLIQEFIASYKEEKTVEARIIADGSSEKMKLTIDPIFGLKGFRSLTEKERKQEKATNYN